VADVCSWLPQQVLRQHSQRAEHQIRWQVDDLRVILLTTLADFPIDTVAYYADIEDFDEVRAPGYTAGGEPLLAREPVYDPPTRQVRLLADPTQWAGRILAEGAVIWKDTGDPERSPLVGIVDFDGPRMSVDKRFVIDWHPEFGALAYKVVVPAQFDTLAAA
jgi:hypothetical protein